MANSSKCTWKHPVLEDYRCAYEQHPGADGMCFFHWKDHDKDQEEFTRRLSEIISQAGLPSYDLRGFVFPHLVKLGEITRIREEPGLRLSYATFGEEADFTFSTFGRGTRFFRATFGKGARFTHAVFGEGTSFIHATFGEGADFIGAEFGEDTLFGRATFEKGTSFSHATFEKGTSFSHATFGEGTSFTHATFGAGMDFREATFGEGTIFPNAIFGERADFRGATFCEGVRFEQTRFLGRVNFTRACFTGAVAFRGTAGVMEESGEAFLVPQTFIFSDHGEAMFRDALFDERTKVQFQEVYLGRTSFLGTDLRGVDFLNCTWAKDKNRNNVLHDEIQLRKSKEDAGEKKNRLRLTQILYQQLKKNYEDAKDFATAGTFHYGEMQMRRLRQHPFWRHGIGALNLYRLASGYGESYQRAFGVFLLLVLLLAVPFTVSPGFLEARNAVGEFVPIQVSAVPSPVTQRFWLWPKENVRWLRENIGDPVLYSFRSATLLRTLPLSLGRELYPTPGLAQWLTTALSVFGPIQIVLFFLALRRKLRR